MEKQQVGVIGLAVMGKNLALNIAEHGFAVSVYNRSPEKTDELLKESEFEHLIGTFNIQEFVDSLEMPRKIIMMVKAGNPVDDTIQQLLPFLSEGDIVMDGGNSFFKDTIRRNIELKQKKIHFMGIGISGGEEGARNGPAIMPGGDFETYKLIEPILNSISAKVDDEPCCTYIGDNGAGHFVKMVHNGIEYADMQLICESYFILKNMLHLTPPQLHKIFAEWNEGELNSYLIEITSDIFAKKDDKADGYLVDKILDVAGQKGTGKWTSQVSLDMGIAIPTITEAVFERCLSAVKGERVLANHAIAIEIPDIHIENEAEFIESIRRALYASKICAYAQGFSLMREASKEYDWALQLGEISKIFRGGCIIRAQFLNKIKDAYQKDSNLTNLILDDYFKEILGKYQKDWRKVVSIAIEAGIAIPGFSSAISYFDGYRTLELPMNLLQAQRDYFGAHTYQRTDMEGTFHTNW
ncbi:NADP-dependent phosphogluconate dehydrogenase [[Clostridium] fimetarium]|uniref:6-phosphogluconate dehydrogenase, decarboxylating n=1 Tax=[Clostridium] fimetarium TaxID=99656 RepID=A0A1I0RKZ5_9FIRM|nr:NADP-dependent phosphogluconate dehydrogenase [[Clostridium] fimetarium]SEW40992.1 6-phosphogluconate dehydrogenase [[Clostridium] fimetarium]